MFGVGAFAKFRLVRDCLGDEDENGAGELYYVAIIKMPLTYQDSKMSAIAFLNRDFVL
jgi:hypothetical protein